MPRLYAWLTFFPSLGRGKREGGACGEEGLRGLRCLVDARILLVPLHTLLVRMVLSRGLSRWVLSYT